MKRKSTTKFVTSDGYSYRLHQLSISLQVEENFDLLFERELNDPDAPYRALRDENQIHGDDAGYQYLADWITE